MKYKSLITDHPELFNNEDAKFEIIFDDAVISAWQAEKRKELQEKGQPMQWADIGVILDDPYNIIIRDLVRFPYGAVRGYGRSIATASLRGGLGAVILPMYEGKVMLLHQYRHPTRQWHYEVPRGYGEPNTPAADNARKEIEEETGGQVAELVDLGTFHNNTGYEAAAVSLFFAKLSSIGAPNENEGIESFTWLTVPELEAWIADGKITDGFTIAAYTKAKLRGLL